MKSSLEILDVGEVHVPRPKLMVTGGNGLVGSTINYFDLGINNKDTKHVQSMNFATDLIVIKLLLNNNIFNNF